MLKEVLTGNLVFFKLYFALQSLICISDYSFSIKHHNTLKSYSDKRLDETKRLKKFLYRMFHKNEMVFCLLLNHRGSI